MQYFIKYANIILLLATVLVLQACDPVVIKEATKPDISEPDVIRAEGLKANGNPSAAAELYLGLASRSQSPKQQEYLLRAAEAWREAGEWQEVANALIKIPDLLPAHQAFRKNLLAAEIAVTQKRGQDALAYLATEPSPETATALLLRFYRIKAEALQLSGNTLEGAKSLSHLDSLLTDPSQRLDNQLAIIQLLGTMSEQVLELFQNPPPETFSGWMELARINKYPSRTAEGIQLRLMEWRQKFPQHPVMPELLEQHQEQSQARFINLQTLAVFLPQSGPFTKAARVIRDGFMAAYYTQPQEEQPQIRFYDSSNPELIWPLYQQAIADGADIIIGPLSKSAVAQLGLAGELPIPVLALNRIRMDTAPPLNFYQYSLAPEDEASQIADKAWGDQLRSALVFTPNNNWGKRIFESFRSRWESLGGTLVGHETYSAKDSDFSTPIRRLLNLDRSQARYRQMKKILGGKLNFEPQRRQDAELIVLAAKPQKAREIRPQLQFHRASRLPVYTTSHIYTGTPDPSKDHDLEGLIFPDIPWVLEDKSGDPVSHTQLKQLFPSSAARYTRLYAMGIDAYRLLPHMLRLQSHPSEVLEGATGKLFMDEGHQIHRQLVWAKIRKGIPSKIGYVPRMDSTLPSMNEESIGLPMTPPPTR